MAIEVHFWSASDLRLGPGKIAIPRRALLHLIFKNVEDHLGIDRNKLVLVELQCVKDNTSTPITLLKQGEEESIVRFVVHLNLVEGEAACDRHRHLANSACELWVNVH